MPSLRVEVVYALPGAQEVVKLELPEDANAGDAVVASGLPARYALAAWTLGLAGRRILPAQRLRDGDRVELLRPLLRTPNEARRARARRRGR
jgi:putative ubiquitin-RnfH superfamily antitoxin RatB of RatAB toxin-antitoxin module